MHAQNYENAPRDEKCFENAQKMNESLEKYGKITKNSRKIYLTYKNYFIK